MKIESLSDVHRYLESLIPETSKRKFPGDFGLKRAAYLLNLAGNPQESIKVIHIAGTSGKGSTSYLISHLLQSHGFNVGLSISPYIIDLRERFQINNTFITEKKLCTYLHELIPFIEKTGQSQFGMPTYFEVVTALAFSIFSKSKVDYAVMETGMGGLYDATNTVHNENKIAVITKIGFDHMHILGNTLSKIAYQKAKIIHRNNLTISIEQKPQVQKVLDRVAEEEKTKVIYIRKGVNMQNVFLNKKSVRFDYTYKQLEIADLEVHIPALYQTENTSLALAVLQEISIRDHFQIKEEKVRKLLKQVTIPGRLEIRTLKNKTLIIDGAHNPQKMQAFITSLKKLYPGKKFNFLLAFKKNKDYQHMLNYIFPLANHITLTSFKIKEQDLPHSATEPSIIKAYLNKKSYYSIDTTENPITAFQNEQKRKEEILVVTGSLYLISRVYNLIKAG